MPREAVLILGGTRDARELAGLLTTRGYKVITSLAGVTTDPVLPPGEIRRGGFGGAAGLGDYLARQPVAVVIDATHPFAARISGHAHAACETLGLPLLRLERPAWQPSAEDNWTTVTDAAAAAAALADGARVLLTIGRRQLAPFFERPGLSGVIRCIEPPDAAVPPGWRLLRERPPFSLEAEMHLIRGAAISHVVSKNAGGAPLAAKLLAARALRIPVIMIARPHKPETATAVTAEALAAAVERLLCP
ncbi:MAG: cobalt-precorrin-6A reductase [Aestuariivirga sp.]|uniref:cobalt-precorrin-6A reductase n=1 Tax=Aestuariivirga sp. TaxID=2650926 RepID=UPI0038D10E82